MEACSVKRVADTCIELSSSSSLFNDAFSASRTI
jgi:hypothetical protein